MSLEIRHLRYAVLTADTRSFSRAAQTLNMKQSTLSRRVMELEHLLGVRLFDRTTRGAEPTETGKVFLEVARRIVTDVDNLRTTARAVNYGEAGRISVGFSSSLMAGNLKLALADYLTNFPDVQFDGIEASPEQLLHGLHTRTVDVAIVPADISGACVRKETLWSERVMVVLPEGHALADQERIYWTDLRREVFVIPQGGIGATLANLLAARLTDQRNRPNLIVQSTSHETIVSMVTVGKFITVATDAMLGVGWPGLVLKEIHDPGGQARLDFSVFWREDNDNPALKRFFKLLRDRYPALAAT